MDSGINYRDILIIEMVKVKNIVKLIDLKLRVFWYFLVILLIFIII